MIGFMDTSVDTANVEANSGEFLEKAFEDRYREKFNPTLM